MRWMRIVALCLVACLGLGCFVFNQLDASQKEIDSYGRGHTPHHASPEPSAASAPKAQAASTSSTAAWWRKAHTLGSEKVEQDIVPCRIHGQVQFMRKNDCSLRGGSAG